MHSSNIARTDDLRAKCGLGQYLSRPLEGGAKDGFSTFSRRRKAGKGALKAAHIWLKGGGGGENGDTGADAELRRLGRQLKQAHHKRRIKEDQLRKLQSYNALSMYEKEAHVYGPGPGVAPSAYVPGQGARHRASQGKKKGTGSKAAWR